MSVHPTDPRTAYLACNSGVYKTTDMGTTWVQEGVQDLIYRDVAIDPANPEHIFADSGGIDFSRRAFDAPPCMMKAVVVFLALGFILSAILSWVFDITPQGIKRTADISPDEAVDIVRQLEAQARQEFVRGYLSALIYAGTGRQNKSD